MNERMRVIFILLWGMGAVACGKDAKHETVQKNESATSAQEIESLQSNETLSFAADLDEVEACSIERPGDCIRPPNLGTKKITVCGHDLIVPVLSAAACYGVVNMVPVACTVGSTISAGGLCLGNALLVAGACGVAQSSVYAAAECCAKGGC